MSVTKLGVIFARRRTRSLPDRGSQIKIIAIWHVGFPSPRAGLGCRENISWNVPKIVNFTLVTAIAPGYSGENAGRSSPTRGNSPSASLPLSIRYLLLEDRDAPINQGLSRKTCAGRRSVQAERVQPSQPERGEILL